MDSNASPGPTQNPTPTPPPPTSASASTVPIFLFPPPPPFPAAPRAVDLSALEFILGLIAVISIPALIYTFFFSIKCPRLASSSSASAAAASAAAVESPSQSADASEVNYSREIHGNDLGDECSVCLSAFGEGVGVKRLSPCGHAFHSACVDRWLSSHPNCPVCRAPVSVPGVAGNTNSGGGSNNNSNRNHQRSSRTREDDFHQGLPDASNLV